MASIVELQNQLLQSHEQIRMLSQEIASVNQKLTYLDNDRLHKEQKISELEAANTKILAMGINSEGKQLKLIDLKSMAPKCFAGKPEESFRSWAKKVRSYCNASRPGFRKFLKWVESATEKIDPENIDDIIQWKYKEVANDVLYDFLVLHTTDDAQILVELQDENGLEAWRQLCLRFDPVGESYVFDQMSNLMEVHRCAQLAELPAAISKWEKSHSIYVQKTGGKHIPEEWKLPILFKMIPKNQLDDIKLRHKYAQGEDKTYAGFSRILIELANEKRYEAKHVRGKDDMDVDALGSEHRTQEYPEYTETDAVEYETWLQEELNWLGAKGKGKGKGGKGGGSKGAGKGAGVCHWCNKSGHFKRNCKEFEKWKVEQDKKREQEGKPPFQPKGRRPGVYSLQPESSEDYVALGLCEEDEEDCDMLDADNEHETPYELDDSDYMPLCPIDAGNSDEEGDDGDFVAFQTIGIKQKSDICFMTPISNTFDALSVPEQNNGCPEVDAISAQNSPGPRYFDFSPTGSQQSTESVTDRICREIDEMKTRLTSAQIHNHEGPSSRTRTTNNFMSSLPEEMKHQPTSIFTAMQSGSIDVEVYTRPSTNGGAVHRTRDLVLESDTCLSGCEIGVQTDLSLSISLDQLTWAPSLCSINEKTIVGEDAKLELAIKAQESDVLPDVTGQEEIESDSDRDNDDEYGEMDGFEECEEEHDEDDLPDTVNQHPSSTETPEDFASWPSDCRFPDLDFAITAVPRDLQARGSNDVDSLKLQPMPLRHIITTYTTTGLEENCRRARESRGTGCRAGQHEEAVPAFTKSSDSMLLLPTKVSIPTKSTKMQRIEDDIATPLMPVDIERSGKKTKNKESTKSKMRLRRGITMDSGAHHNVIPKRMVGNRRIRPSPGSKRGMNYIVAGGEKIKNFDFESVEGHKSDMVFQVAEVNKALGSVAYVVDRAYRVVYDKNMETGEDLSYMIHKPTKTTYRFRRDRNVWILDAIVDIDSVYGDFSGRE